MNATSSIIRAATRKPGERLNILTAATHEAYQTGLSNVNADFYMVQHPSFKKWMDNYRPLPKNHYLLDEKLENRQLPPHIDFDLVFSQNKFGQFQILSQIARQNQLPLVSLEHTLPMEQWSPQERTQLKNMQGNINIFISDYSKTEWGFDDVPNSRVIKHCIDTEVFKPGNSKRKQQILSVCNDWINRDYFCGFGLWQRVTKDLPVFPVGDTKGFSLPAKNVGELVGFYQESQVFINTSQVSPIPTSLLEAMACGCMVISSATCMIPEVIQNGYNGFLTNDEGEMRKYLQLALSDPKMCEEMGKNARQTIIDNFSSSKFTQEWNKVFEESANIII